MVLALAGVMHILFKGDWAARGCRCGINPGDLWVAVAVLCWTAYSLLLRAWPSAFGALARLTLIACGGVLVLIPFTLWEALYWLPVDAVVAKRRPGARGRRCCPAPQPTVRTRSCSACSARHAWATVLYLGPLYSAVDRLGRARRAHRVVPRASVRC